MTAPVARPPRRVSPPPRRRLRLSLRVGPGATGLRAAVDRLGCKPLIVGGLLVQAPTIAGIATVQGFPAWLGAAAPLGVGTVMV